MNFEQVTAYLEEKFGVSLDWASDTILPMLKELMHRVTVYHIVSDSIIIVVCLLVIIGSMIFFAKEIKAYREQEDSSWFLETYGDLTFSAIMITVILAMFTAVAIVLSLWAIGNLLNWVFIPEVQFFKYVSVLIG